MSILCFEQDETTCKWKSKIVGKAGSHIENIEESYNVKLSLRNRSNELYLVCFNGDIIKRKDCFNYIKDKIAQYKEDCYGL